ncbi:hypothetical protein LMG23992_02251 [Cupriavidus laharis]|uniref:Right-handed parallel beta-helix repeat-containing protein n=1 Tax=Cupriavidus laharis TaxID=151654 RepID=A0ABM8WY63_9BURK|nr:right-handed parallel beta-helix repeat-containing protein [Cupriavidus laharis]CAG9172496.1 hypothetical protein LMG23992_02251 [Cupriavidus laharis]
MNAPLSPARILRYLDDVKLLTHPLPAHYARTQDEAVRDAYARLLAVVLLCEPVIAESRQRLFRMLLESLDVAEQEGEILAAAQDIDRPFLRDCADMFVEAGLARSFMTDAAILLRVAGTLSYGQQTLLSELAHIFRLKAAELRTVADIAATVLGRPADEKTFESIEVQEFVVWKEFLGTELTAERLAVGLTGGVWRISGTIEMTCNWSIQDSTLLFLRDGRILTTADAKHRPDASIRNTTLDAPVFVFDQVNAFELRDCDVTGHYLEADQRTAMTFEHSTEVRIINCSLTTIDARALWLTHSSVQIQKCHFHECGNASMPGGAIAVKRLKDTRERYLTLRNGAEFKVSHSRFVDCTASLGGAIRADGLYDAIHNCKLENCSSTRLDEELQHVGVFADYAGSASFSESTFRDAGIRMGDCGHAGSFTSIAISCRFKSSDVLYHEKGQHVTVLHQCTLDDSRSVNSAMNAEDWWFEY